jgi:hypothetical protein
MRRSGESWQRGTAIAAALLAVSFMLGAGASAATLTAKSCSQEDVQAAIDAAGDGDTVIVPAGTSEYRTAVPNTPALRIRDKGIALLGAGIGKTILKDNTYDTGKTHWGSEGMIRAQGKKGAVLRISGFEFDGSGILNAGKTVVVGVSGHYAKVRIDHCQFLNVCSAVQINGDVCGVVDHCRYELMEDHQLGNPGFCGVYGTSATAWQTPTQLGDANAVYIEDCHIEFHNPKSNDSPALATMDGARAVFRHNTVEDGFLEFFGVDSRPRGTQRFEVYDNSFSGKCFCAIGLKGGTGVVFDNTIDGRFNRYPLWATEYRVGGPRQKIGKCDGTGPADGNAPLNGDTEAYTGGHSGGDGEATLQCAGRSWTPDALVGCAVWNTTDGSVGKITANSENTITAVLEGGKRNSWNTRDGFKVTNGYPALDQIGRGCDASADVVQPQKAAPVYAWGNTYNGAPCPLRTRGYYPREEEYIREGRDFFNMPKPGYTPLAYPHPLEDEKAWEELMKSAAAREAASDGPAAPASKP